MAPDSSPPYQIAPGWSATSSLDGTLQEDAQIGKGYKRISGARANRKVGK
jgi:hypothetical protein